MDSEDVLGNDGREALKACVKVRTCSVPELQEYDRKTALERLKSCYGGRFPRGFESWLLFDPLKLYDVRVGRNIPVMKRYDIHAIHQALLDFDKVSYVDKYPQNGSEEVKAIIDRRRDEVSKEIEEAKVNPDKQRKYSRVVARRRVTNCFAGNFAGDEGLLDRKTGEKYNITDIFNAVKKIQEDRVLIKYPEDEGDGSEQLKKEIDEKWNELTKEHEDAEEHPFRVREYSRSEAERRVRDCFAGAREKDTNIFINNQNSRSDTFTIFQIKCAIDHFDQKKLIDRYPKAGRDEEREKVDNQRASILTEYDQHANADKMTQIDYGTGFIHRDGFIITNKHVIQSYLDDKEKCKDKGRLGLFISNEVIDKPLSSTVVTVDCENDLALLHVPELNLEEKEIHPLSLSTEDLLIGQSVFCFSYPITHTGQTALFVKGYVSGYKEKLYSDPLVTMTASLASGCSGSPVMRRTNGEITVRGVVKEAHTQEIFDDDDRATLTIFSRKEMANALKKLFLRLILKLYNALTSTHTPFNYINVIPARKVNDLVEKAKRERNAPAMNERLADAVTESV